MMEEDDHDELLQCTDDESLSETEDQCLPIDKPEENYRNTLTYFHHTQLEFFTTKILLIISTTILLILLPMYMESINVNGNVYSMILTNTFLSAIIFAITVVLAKLFCTKYKHLNIFSLPLTLKKILWLDFVYFMSIFMILYSLDRKRVLCHLQDPIKGVVLVFSLLFYFFFCRKLMGLQRIFSATTIIVGLFIAVDYGLCDEFRCRGFERVRISDDNGIWNWQTHAVWTAVYITGLALFAAFFTIMERFVLANTELEFHTIDVPASFLSTVSRTVSFPSSNSLTTPIIFNESREISSKKNSVVHLAMWMHLIGFGFVVLAFWTDLIPALGRDSKEDFFNHTISGVFCHFEIVTKDSGNACGRVSTFSWLFLLNYIIFIIMSMKFLVLSQSAVYTTATMSMSLPLIGIWWSLFHVSPQSKGFLIWSPSVTGELICSLLGLPIITIGLILLCKSHFKDYQWCRLTNQQNTPTHLA